MRDSNVANVTKESAQVDFSHGLLDFCTVPSASPGHARADGDLHCQPLRPARARNTDIDDKSGHLPSALPMSLVQPLLFHLNSALRNPYGEKASAGGLGSLRFIAKQLCYRRVYLIHQPSDLFLHNGALVSLCGTAG
jgi:hypothetical protein